MAVPTAFLSAEVCIKKTCLADSLTVLTLFLKAKHEQESCHNLCQKDPEMFVAAAYALGFQNRSPGMFRRHAQAPSRV